MRNRVLTTALIVLFLMSGSLLIPSGDIQATWITITNEHFTQPWLNWPWTPWSVLLSPNGYGWGIAPDITYYNFEPLQSIWCAGLLGGSISNLEPFIDPYPNGMNTMALWGPFSLVNALAAECQLWYWVDIQTYYDYLRWGVTTDPYGINFYEGGRHSGPNPTWNWATTTMDLSQLVSASGDTVSLIGYSPLYLAFHFYSNGSIQDEWGAFVDDIALGYDDGLFDLEAGAPSIHEDDSTQVIIPYEGGYYRFGLPWECEGIGTTPDFNIDCEVDGELFYTIRLRAEGGQSYYAYSDTLWTGDLGLHVVEWMLDADDEVAETYEDNNIGYMEFEVMMFDSMPYIEILRPTEGDIADEGFWIKWFAYDRESNAQIYLYYDGDSTGYNGIIINPGNPIYEDTDPDSFWWNTSSLPDSVDYYICGMISDLCNAAVYDYSDYPLHIHHESSVEPGGGAFPSEFILNPNFPNPFNAWTTISYSNPEPAIVNLRIFDLEGRLVEELVSGEIPPGVHSINWNTDGSTGIYFCRLQMRGLDSGKVFNGTQKMLLVR